VTAGAPVPTDDRGLLLGDGLFETLLYSAGDLVLASNHAARMAAGASVLGLNAPSVEAFAACALAAVRLAGLEAGRAAIRVTLTAGSGGRGLDRPAEPEIRLFATAAAAAAPTAPASLITATVRRNQDSPTSRLKTLAYLDNVLARREATALGADEAVMLNTHGHVACAAAANLFWLRDGALFTPASETGRLAGIMAGQVGVAADRLGVELRRAACGDAALDSADAIFLTNSLIGVRPAYLLGRNAISHPLVERLKLEVSAWT
jgi:branched-chain amino acid aminotransferase/4-amino-4-deoxychorismate lyase